MDEKQRKPLVRLTKAQLLEAIKDYPDDAPVVVSGGMYVFLGIKADSLEGYDENRASVWAVSNDPKVITLEL